MSSSAEYSFLREKLRTRHRLLPVRRIATDLSVIWRRFCEFDTQLCVERMQALNIRIALQILTISMRNDVLGRDALCRIMI